MPKPQVTVTTRLSLPLRPQVHVTSFPPKGAVPPELPVTAAPQGSFRALSSPSIYSSPARNSSIFRGDPAHQVLSDQTHA